MRKLTFGYVRLTVILITVKTEIFPLFDFFGNLHKPRLLSGNLITHRHPIQDGNGFLIVPLSIRNAKNYDL